MTRRLLPRLLFLVLVPLPAAAASADAIGPGNFGHFVLALIVAVGLALGLQQVLSFLTVAGGVGGDHTLRELVETMGGPGVPEGFTRTPTAPLEGAPALRRTGGPRPRSVGEREPVGPATPSAPLQRMPNAEPLEPGSGTGSRMAFTTSAGERQGQEEEGGGPWDTAADWPHLAIEHGRPDFLHPVSGEMHGATGATEEVETGSNTLIAVVNVGGRFVGADGTESSAHPSSGGTPRLSRIESTPAALVERVGRWAVLWSFIALFCGGWLAVSLTPTANVFAGLMIGIAVWVTYHVIVSVFRAAAFLSLEGSLVRIEVEHALERRRHVAPTPIVKLPTSTWAIASAAVGGGAAVLGGLVAALV